MTIEEATPEQWATPATRWLDAILELRARVEQLEAGLKDEADCNKTCTFNIVDRVKALEAKYETMRLAALEWGQDVEKVKRWSDQHLQRIEKLEGTRRPASKVYEINEPLKLTPEQAQQVRDLLAPEPRRNYPAKPDSSLAKRVQHAIYIEYARSKGVGCPEARSAIREVAAWLREQQDGDLVAATMLEREGER